jgi:hypothetical protein
MNAVDQIVSNNSLTGFGEASAQIESNVPGVYLVDVAGGETSVTRLGSPDDLKALQPMIRIFAADLGLLEGGTDFTDLDIFFQAMQVIRQLKKRNVDLAYAVELQFKRLETLKYCANILGNCDPNIVDAPEFIKSFIEVHQEELEGLTYDSRPANR